MHKPWNTARITLSSQMVNILHVGVADGHDRVVAITGPENDLESIQDAARIALLPELLAILEELANRYDRLETLYAQKTGLHYDAKNGTLARARKLLLRSSAINPRIALK